MMKAERMPSFNRCAAAVLVALGLLSGCKGSVSMSDAEHIARAREFQAKGSMPEAIIEIKNAIQKNPKSGEARWLLGEIYAERGDGPEAEKELLKAEEFGISMESIKVPLARAFLAQGKFDRVIREIEPGPESSAINAAKILDARGRAQRGLGKNDDACALFAEASKRNPRYVEAYWGMAWCELIKDKFDQARAALQTALKLDENNAGSWALIGELERGSKREAEAEAAYSKALKLRPEHTKARLGRAALYVESKKFPAATQDVDAVLARYKDNPEALHLRGVSLYHQGKYQDAKTSFELALRNTLNPAPTLLWLGLTNYAMGNLEQAADHLRRFVRAAPGALEAKALLAYIDASRGGTEQAKETLTALRDVKFKDPQSLAAVGRAFMLVGDAEAGSKYFAQAVENDPGATEPRINLASSLIRGGRESQAVAQLEKAIELNPESKDAEQMLVLSLLRQKKYDEALRAVDQALAKHAKEAWPHNFRGAVFTQKGDTAAAAKAYQQALELEPGNPASTHSLAFLALKDGKIDDARAWYQRTLDKNNDHWQTLLALAALEQQAGRAAEARQLLERAAAKHGAEPAVAITLGKAYLANNDPAKTISVTETASKQAPNNAELLQLRGAAYAASGDATNARFTYEQLVKLAEKSPDAHYRLATAHAIGKDSKAMRAALGRALALDVAHVPALMALARLNLSEGKVPEAASLVEKLQKAQPKAAETALLQAELAIKRKDAQQALAKLDQALALGPAAIETRFTIAQRYLELGQAARAVPVAQQLVKTAPDKSELVDLLGAAQLAAGRPREAAQTFERLATLLPHSAAVQVRLASAKKAAQDLPGALTALKTALSIKPDQPAVKALLAEAHAQTGEYDQALSIARELQRESPRAPLGHQLEGDVLAAQKKLPEALAKYDAAYALKPNPTLAIKLYETRSGGQPNLSAARELEQWVRDHPKDSGARLYLAGVDLGVSEYAKAAAHYEAVLKDDPQNVVALNNLAWARHQAGQPGALQAAEQAYRLAPTSPNVMDTYGYLLVEGGKTNQGVELLQKALAAAPDQHDIRFHLGAGLAKAGDRAGARAELEKLLNIPAFKDKNQVEQLLRSL